jgi:hypothetical protein
VYSSGNKGKRHGVKWADKGNRRLFKNTSSGNGQKYRLEEKKGNGQKYRLKALKKMD